MINFEDFAKVELKIGTVIEAEEVEGSEKLVKMKVDLGEDEPRQILGGIKKHYSPEDIKGKQIVVVANLEPRELMGEQSQGMMLVADGEDGMVFLTSEKEVPAGTQIH